MACMITEPSTTPAAAIATRCLPAPEDPVNGVAIGVAGVVVECCVDDDDGWEEEELARPVLVVMLGLLLVPVTADVEPVASGFECVVVSKGVAVVIVLDEF